MAPASAGEVAHLSEGMHQFYVKATTTTNMLTARVDSHEAMMQALQAEIVQLREEYQSGKAAGNKKATTRNVSNDHLKLKVSHVCVCREIQRLAALAGHNSYHVSRSV
jgi:hypothetical protein